MMQQTLALPRVICFFAYSPNRSSLIYICNHRIAYCSSNAAKYGTPLFLQYLYCSTKTCIPRAPKTTSGMSTCPYSPFFRRTSPRFCRKLWVIYGVFYDFLWCFLLNLLRSSTLASPLSSCAWRRRLRTRKRQRRLRRCGGWRRPWSGWPKRKRNRGAQNWGGRNGGFTVSPCFTKQCMELSMEIS